MLTLDAKYPGYGLAQHAGYATEAHRSAVALLGPSPIHRRSFHGVKEFISVTYAEHREDAALVASLAAAEVVEKNL